jgi:hypothetical protein
MPVVETFQFGPGVQVKEPLLFSEKVPNCG